MSYQRTSHGLGDWNGNVAKVLPAGYSLLGVCPGFPPSNAAAGMIIHNDANGNPQLLDPSHALVRYPDNSQQCLDQSAFNALALAYQGSTSPASVFNGSGPTLTSPPPVLNGGPVICNTPQCIADMAAMNAPAAAIATGPLDSIVSWAKSNPLLAGAIAIGGVFLVSKL